jgi:glycosyltransferase involved in cell wall biosynthesis
MKIVVIDTTVHGEMIGGGHLIVVPLLRGLKNLGHEVHYVSADTPNPVINESIASTGVTLHKRLWDSAAFVDNSTPSFAAWLNKLKPDVHLISASGDLGWTVLPLLDPNIATLTIGHNDREAFYAPVRHYAGFLTRAIGVSDEICRKYIEECAMPADRVEWIPYGVETSNSAPVTAPDGPLRLVYVGRFDNVQKRISDVVAVIRKLSASGIDFEFNLVGDGEEMPRVMAALSDEIESGRVRVHGWLKPEQVIDVMRQSEVFILASEYEGFCISLIEAMANGCTPVVTDIRSGNKQLVRDGENGFIVPIGDVEAFVDRIKLLDSDRGSLSRMRTLAWETGREYGVERMVDNYVDCFERAIENARVSPRTPNPSFPLMESCRSKYPLWLRRIKGKAQSFLRN